MYNVNLNYSLLLKGKFTQNVYKQVSQTADYCKSAHNNIQNSQPVCITAKIKFKILLE